MVVLVNPDSSFFSEKEGDIMKRVGRNATALVMTILLVVNLFNINVYAANSIRSVVNKKPAVSKALVTKSKFTVKRDSSGKIVIALTNVKPLPRVISRLKVRNYVKTTVMILPDGEAEAKEVIDNIISLKNGSGSYTEDGYFYGSSVYLKSTINYSTSVSSGINYGKITKVTISASTNSGSSISSMSLLMGQNGWAPGGYKSQSSKFNATTARSFTPPSSWVSVKWDSTKDVGAHITCTAVRKSGKSTFDLYNSLS